MKEKEKRLRICLLSPWHGGSHRRWADGLVEYSRHEIAIHGLPARHWKWRMHGAAITLAEELLSRGKEYDLILADDMMDVAVFAGLIRGRGIQTPIATYFHENQISYPVSPRDTDLAASRDLHYGYINYTSALVSDIVYFNSHYHRESFLGSLGGFLDRFPDFQNKESLNLIRDKSEVLPLGMDLRSLDSHQPVKEKGRGVPLIVWNHRWEYDKCPEDFLHLLVALKDRGLEFQVALLGERGVAEPPLLEVVRGRLGDAVVQDGPVDDFGEYINWLWRADILPVTSVQDFFGGSVVEAIYAGCHPVLPCRLAYPEHIRDPAVFYHSLDEAVDQVEALIRSGTWRQASPYIADVRRYDWSQLVDQYDEAFASVAFC